MDTSHFTRRYRTQTLSNHQKPMFGNLMGVLSLNELKSKRTNAKQTSQSNILHNFSTLKFGDLYLVERSKLYSCLRYPHLLTLLLGLAVALLKKSHKAAPLFFRWVVIFVCAFRNFAHTFCIMLFLASVWVWCGVLGPRCR